MCFARASATRWACSQRLRNENRSTPASRDNSMLTLLRLNEAIAMLYAFHKMDRAIYSVA